jgi:hypothetical protein
LRDLRLDFRRRLPLVHLLVLALLLAGGVELGRPAPVRAAPALPADKLHFGLSSHATDMDWFRASGAPWRYRYLYLAGGVNTADAWPTWQDPARPPGQYAVDFMNDSASVGAIPVFTWYELLQSNPQLGGSESDRDWAHLTNAGTMSSYYASFQLLMQRAGAFGRPLVVHVEPDLWGYLQQRARSDASVVPTAQSFTQQLRSLRDQYATNVILATHASMWSSGFDLATNTDPSLNPEAEADTTSAFLGSVGSWDAVFNDVDDHNAAWWEQNGNPWHWWDKNNRSFPNFSRYLRWVKELRTRTGLPQLAWQVPVGNQYFLTMNNTCGHYQDNVAEYFIGHPQDLFNAGLVGVLFGAGNACQTTPYDSQGDGVTNNGGVPTTDAAGACNACNTHVSQYADDDGGYLRLFVAAYYATPPPEPGRFNPITPFRLVDTRQWGSLGPDSSMPVQVSGRGGLPSSGVSAAAINITVTQPTDTSYVSVYPASTIRPEVSNLNFSRGQTIANLSQVALSQSGQVSVYNSQGWVHVILDLVGFYTSPGPSDHSGLYRPLVPTRVLDTRIGTGGYSTPFGPNTRRDLDLRIALPDQRASAVVLNLTAVGGSEDSLLTAYPAGTGGPPLASNLNFPAGRDLPNRVIARLGSGASAGRISLYNAVGYVNVVADLVGWFTDGTDTAATGGLFHPLVPQRILDTRPLYQVGPYSSPLGQDSSMVVAVAGRGGISAAATAAALNVAVTNTTTGSFLTVYPSGQAFNVTSDLNFRSQETIANLDLARLGAAGAVIVYNNLGSADVFIDAEGWYG